MREAYTELFGEEYRVLAVEAERLTIKGTMTGTVLTIVNSAGIPLTPEEYPVGQLLILTDPASSAPN
jgi:hypothetical protein